MGVETSGLCEVKATSSCSHSPRPHYARVTSRVQLHTRARCIPDRNPVSASTGWEVDVLWRSVWTATRTETRLGSARGNGRGHGASASRVRLNSGHGTLSASVAQLRPITSRFTHFAKIQYIRISPNIAAYALAAPKASRFSQYIKWTLSDISSAVSKALHKFSADYVR